MTGGGPRQLPKLVRRFRKGEAKAVREVRFRVQRILSFRGYRISQEDLRDLEQVIMTQLWQAARDPAIDLACGFWAFVETVTTRRVIDWMRVQREHSALDPGVAAESDPLADTLSRERTDLAHATLKKLPEACRRLIHLHLSEGKSYREISEALDRSEGALRAQMYRCIRRARDLLEELRTKTREEKSSRGDRS